MRAPGVRLTGAGGCCAVRRAPQRGTAEAGAAHGGLESGW